MMTMRVFGANQGAWQYLSNTVVTKAYGQDRGTDMATYYMTDGTPPGQWAGSGLSGLKLDESAEVTPALLEKLYGLGVDPITESPLGERFKESKSLQQRVEERVAELNLTTREKELISKIDGNGSFHGSDADQIEFLAVIEKVEAVYEDEKGKPQKESVAGFEMVFSPPKSVSSWWAIADPSLKDEIRKAHKDAIQTTIKMLEDDVIKTRIGEGGIAQADVKGIVASLFDHWDSREGDPQLHTHMLVSNKVQTLDGKWRTIDSKTLFYHVSTASMVYDTSLMDTLSNRLGVEWTTQDVLEKPTKYKEWRSRQGLDDSPAARHQFSLDSGTSPRSVKWQIHDIPQKLNREFSTRSNMIYEEKEKAINDYVARYGRMPSDDTIIKFRQQAALRTRRSKRILSLKELTKGWRERAKPIIGDTFISADRIKAKGRKRLNQYSLWTYRQDDIDAKSVDAVVAFTLSSLSTYSTWRRSNAESAVMNATAHWRFRSSDDRRAVTKRITEAVVNAAVPLTPKNHLHVPYQFQLPDGADRFQPKSHDLFTTKEIWEAEERIILAGRNIESVAVDAEVVDALIGTPTGAENRILSPDQAAAVTSLLTSGRQMDILVGPAGAGKTTSLEKLREIWETQYGPGSVRGLAPTARAAEVLAESLGIETENTAKWIHETTSSKTLIDGFDYNLKPGDLLIIDEASIAGTVALDTIRSQAEQAGAKLLLVGDWAQLAAVDAGGAFGLLAGDRKDVAELTALHRFKEDWEAEASKLLRLGRSTALDHYIQNDRIHHGLDETIIEKVVEAWKIDESKTGSDGNNYTSLLIAPTNEMVERLNTIARQWRIDQGQVSVESEAITASGAASVGDRIVTRQNARTIRTDKDRWVKNNDEWVIEKIQLNGDIVAKSGEETVLLPKDYAKEHIQLAYATTAHRSQGRTVDTAHTLVDSSSTRETFYVAMTRGKLENHAYVIEDEDGLLGDASALGMSRTWRETLDSVLAKRTSNTAAHSTYEMEAERIGSIRQLAAEYQTITAEALSTQYVPILTSFNLIDSEAPDSPYLGPVMANLRRLELSGIEPTQIIDQAFNQRSLDDAGNPLAVLHYRLGRELENQREISHYRSKYTELLDSFNIDSASLENNVETLTFFRALDAVELRNDTTPKDQINKGLVSASQNSVSGQQQIITRVTATILDNLQISERELPTPKITANADRIAGLIEAAPLIQDEDVTTALKDRETAIQIRAEMIVDQAIENNEPWIKELGLPLIGEEPEWRNRAVTVACYRDLYGVDTVSAVDKGLLKQRTRVNDRRIATRQLVSNRQYVQREISRTLTVLPIENALSNPMKTFS